MTTCAVCATPHETASSFCGRCGNAFPQTAHSAVVSTASTAAPHAVAPAGPRRAELPPKPPAALTVRMPDGATAILTLTGEHVLVQGDSTVQRWALSDVRDIRHDASSVRFVAGGQELALDVTSGDPAEVFGPSSGAAPSGAAAARGDEELPATPLAWTLVGAVAAGTLGLLLMLADDLPFAFAGGLWMIGVVTPGIAALRVVLRCAPPGQLEGFHPVRPVVEAAGQFAPAIGGFGAVLLLTEAFPGTPFLLWTPMAVASGVAAWLLWRLTPNRTDEGEAGR